jgi:tetratricopeptide (TPR) repeat protein
VLAGKLILVFAISLLIVPIASAAPSPLLSKAETAFGEGQWESAREIYRDMMQDRPDLPSGFYYNYGTIALRAGSAGEAFVLLQKAALSDPLDRDVRANFQLARAQLPEKARSIQPATWVSWWPARGISWQAWLLAAMLTIGPFLWAKSRRRRSQAWQEVLAVAGLFLLIGGFLAVWQLRSPAAGLLTAAKVFSGPGPSFLEITSLEAGSLVNLEEAREGWTKIRFRAGQGPATAGWLETPALLILH